MFELANEEDVKNKLLVPYLLSLGFDISELSFERSFQLRVGRSLRPIDDIEKKVSIARPRLDILVKRNGQNLFIVEVKGPNIDIDPDDIDQAVCYAKLLHPIAPVCLLTNGNDWKLINSLTKKELAQQEVGPQLSLNVTLPDEEYYQTLKHFFGYSQENILAFCKWQVKNYMKELLGSADDRDKKYIPELYAERRHLIVEMQQFMQAEAQCFGVVGDSGSGKTCWACDSAIHSLEQGIVTFFYRGADVAGGILEAICRDLNWTLSVHYNDIQAVKRLLDLFENKQIVIWIDDIDGLPLVLVRRTLSEFLRRTIGYSVKLLLTCKSETWKYLLEEDGSPTPLASYVFQVDAMKGFRVGPLDNEGLQAVIEKYRAFYHFSGAFDIEVLEMCRRVPFLLRILFDVAAQMHLSHITYTLVEFFEAYFQKLYDRFDERKDMIRRLLPKIAYRFYELNSNEIELDDLLDALGFSPLQSLPEQLFTLSILERIDREQTTFIGFYFKKLRDYLIAFRALKWQKKTPQAFQLECTHLDRHGVHLDVVNLYYSLTPSEEHKRVLGGLLYTNASAFLSLYETILDKHFSSFKQSFSPNTSGSIGFVGYVDFSQNAISSYGFRSVRNGDEKVLLMPIAPMPGAWMKENKAFLAGSLLMTYTDSSRGFREINIKDEVLSQNIQPLLKDIIQQGRLDESQNRALLIERVVATCFQYYEADFQRQQGTAQLMFPLRLDDLKAVLLYKIAYEVLQHQLLEKRTREGTIEETRSEFYVSRILQLSPRESIEIENQARELAQAGKNISGERNYQKIEEHELLLLKDIECLEMLGVSEINRSPLTEWYTGGIRRRFELVQDVSHHLTLEQLLENLFLVFLNEYQILVERNFPTLCQHFELYRKVPAKMFWTLGEEVQTPNIPSNSLFLQAIKSELGSENTVIRCNKQKIDQNVQELKANPEYHGTFLHSIGVTSTLLSGNNYLPFKVNNNNMYVVRKLVYREIEKELEKALPFLISEYQM